MGNPRFCVSGKRPMAQNCGPLSLFHVKYYAVVKSRRRGIYLDSQYCREFASCACYKCLKHDSVQYTKYLAFVAQVQTNLECYILRTSRYALIITPLMARSVGPTWGRQDPGGPHVGPRTLLYCRLFKMDTVSKID